MQDVTMRRDINVDYHKESDSWGIRLYDGFRNPFVSWGAKTPYECRFLPYHNEPIED